MRSKQISHANVPEGWVCSGWKGTCGAGRHALGVEVAVINEISEGWKKGQVVNVTRGVRCLHGVPAFCIVNRIVACGRFVVGHTILVWV